MVVQEMVSSPEAEAEVDSRRTFIESLRLRNYRRFGDVTLDFDPKLTVLVAENGGGKTALLDAVAIAIRYLVDELRKVGTHGFERTDVRLMRTETAAMFYMTPTCLDGKATIDGRETSWHRELASIDGRTTYAQAEELKERAQGLLHDLREYADKRRIAPPSLPVIAYYGTGRLWSNHKLTEGKRQVAKDLGLQTSAYVDCLSPSSNFGHFTVWFEKVVREAQNELQTQVDSPHHPQALLSAVRRAADIVLKPSGWELLDWDFLLEEVVASHPEHGRLPVSMLSDGIRNLIALVADLAHRAVRLNPHLREEACQRSPGIVLIDEVDMHLHPSWQQTVIASLREAFSQVQFIVTTHSPLVVSTVPSASVRIVTAEAIRKPELETEGYDSSLALGTVFEVDSTPPVPIAESLNRYRALIEEGEGDSVQAKDLLVELVNHFGSSHPAILSSKSLRRLQDAKERMRADRDR